MRFDFADVVLVPLPLTDQTAVKQRPAIVISSAAYNLARPHLVILALTSQVRAMPDFGEAPVRDWRGAGLLKPSMMKPIVATVEQGLVRKLLGRLVREDVASLRQPLGGVIG